MSTDLTRRVREFAEEVDYALGQDRYVECIEEDAELLRKAVAELERVDALDMALRKARHRLSILLRKHHPGSTLHDAWIEEADDALAGGVNT